MTYWLKNPFPGPAWPGPPPSLGFPHTHTHKSKDYASARVYILKTINLKQGIIFPIFS